MSTLHVGTGEIFSTIQAAIVAANDGDVIEIAAGTYTENLTIDKAVTIHGANAGIAGTDTGVRVAETIIQGTTTVTAASGPVTIDGVEVLNTSDNNTQFIGVSVHTASDVTIENSVFFSSGPNGTHEDRAINLDTTAQGHVVIADNLITGDATGQYSTASWHRGIWSDGATSQLDVTGNTFQNVRSGMNLDGYDDNHTNVSGNTFSNGGTGIAIGTPVTSVITGIHDNTFKDIPDDFNLRNIDPAHPQTFDAGATNNVAAASGSDGVGVLHVLGTLGADTLIGTGAGVLEGGAGNDIYYATSSDTIVELPNQGIDQVLSTDSITLSDNVENLTLLDAATNTQTFDNMATGPITNGENGWKFVGPSNRDQAVVELGGGNKAFHISSDPASGDFGGPYSPALGVAAGEVGLSQYQSQSIKFDFQAASATVDGSRLEIDFANAAGTDRNNFLMIESTGNGLRIAVNEPKLDGHWTSDDFSAFTGNRTLVSGVDQSLQHHLEMRLTYVDGPDNDRVDIYLDGSFIGSSTTFENFRDAAAPAFPGAAHDDNADANLTSRVLFRTGDAGQPTDGPGGQNQGFNVDNLTTSVYNNTSGTGNDGDNAITGNSGDNVLSGLGGNDTLVGNDGNDTLVGGSGDDVLQGGAGIDTASYAGTLSVANITAVADADPTMPGNQAGWHVSAGAEGNDLLTTIEKVSDGAGHHFLLVGNGGYATIQAAINAAAAGDTIEIAAGTYNEHLEINKEVTLEGANHGIAGYTPRGAETVITGGVKVSANGVTVDGVKIAGSYNSNLVDGTDLPNGLYVQSGNHVSVTNSVFTGDAQDSRPFSVSGGVSDLSFTDNVVSGWSEGAYVTNGVSGTISGNTFDGNGNGVLTESTSTTISDNTFSHSTGADIGVLPFDVTVDVASFVHDNTFDPSHPHPITTYLNGPDGQTVTGSDVPETFHLEYHNGGATVHGGAGIDTAQYAGTLVAADITSVVDIDPITPGNQAGWRVSTGEGTDLLTGIEKISDGSGHTFLLVGTSGFATAQSAQAVADPSDTLLVGANALPKDDFDGDGRSDILFHHDSGLSLMWATNGTTVTGGAFLPDIGPAWHVAGAGDFNGDGKSDILFHHESGLSLMWEMDGTTIKGGDFLPNIGPGWNEAATGDFNGDGKSDILFHHDSGLSLIWEMDGTTIKGGAFLPDIGPNWHEAATADFNGDGKSDILFHHDSGISLIWTMDGTTITGAAFLPNIGSDWHSL